MRFAPTDSGYVTVICGPMYCGKSTELIRLVVRAEIAGKKAIVFKPALDTRAEGVSDRQREQRAAYTVTNSGEIETLVGDHDVVAIDEAQFFDSELPSVVDRLAEAGKWIIIAGLDLDFRRQPFGPMPHLMAQAEFVEKLQAVCQVCGGPAFFTQRLIEGHPAPASVETILIGDSEDYEARCRACYEDGSRIQVSSVGRVGPKVVP
jgi:thymidine kinase